jgi:hypothetical protein
MASYTLHIQYVDRPAETRTISQPKLTIGRDAGDIVLHDSQVSGRHAEISWDGTTLRFTDLGSTNGSFLLQGQRVANLELTPGIALRLGNSLITVQTIDGAAAAGKGRTMIAGPGGVVPGFPAPMKNPPPSGGMPVGGLRPPGPPAPGGNLAFAPTAQMQPPSGLRPPAPGQFTPAGPPPPQPGGFAGPPPPQPGGFAGPPPPQPGGFGGPPAPQPGGFPPAPQPGGFSQPATAPFGAAPIAPPAPQYPQQPVATPPNPAPGPAAPTPFPAPQPPGPAPGTLSGAQPQAMPPQPAAPPSGAMPAMPAPAPQPVAVPATTGSQATPGGGVLDSADLGGAIKQIFAGGWSVLAPVAAPVVVVVAAVLIPLSLLGHLMVMALGASIGGLLAMLLALAQFAAGLVLFPAMTRFVLGHYLGQPISIQAAIQEQIAKIADVLVNCDIALIPLGIFAGPIYFVEGKKLGEVVSRNFNLLTKDLVPIIVAIAAGTLGLILTQWILGKIVGLLPFAWLFSAIIFGSVSAFLVAYGAALSVWLYFTVRRKHEGGDPEGEARARLGAPQTALPAA